MATNTPTTPRRGFLRGLLTLPLIGGGVTLIGNPTAAAVPVTERLLDSYDAWLFYERRYLHFERYGRAGMADLGKDEWMLTNRRTGEAFDWVSVDNAGGRYHHKPDNGPSTRAPVVLSTVGCDWRGSSLLGEG
jgi:hypothetical protein